MVSELKALAPQYGINPDSGPAKFKLFRNIVFSQVADMRLYAHLTAGGRAAVKSASDARVDLSQQQCGGYQKIPETLQRRPAPERA